MTSPPQLRVLGNADVVGVDGSPLPLAAKAVALLAYLRLAAHNRAHRAFLSDLLWSEADEEKGRASLRQAVLAVRQQLGDDMLVSSGQELRLSGNLNCDAEAFLASASKGNHLDAVRQYGGPFFADFALPGARGFEMWASIEQERFLSVFIRACDGAVQLLLDEGRAQEAIAVATRLVSTDPSRERSWRLLLECRMAQGDMAGASVDVAAMRAALDADGVEIEPATAALLARIQKGDVSRGEPKAADAPLRGALVGRGRAFAALLSAWRRASVRTQVVITLSGDAGIGKTRLLDDCNIRLRSLGARVICASARVADRDVQYALLQHVTEALCTLPGAAGVSPESARVLLAMDPRLGDTFRSADPDTALAVDIPLRRALAVADLINAVCDERAIAILIDDFHWSDTASRRALLAAVSRTSSARALIVLAQRGVPEPGDSGEPITLAELNSQEIRELIESIARVPTLPSVGDIAEALRGATDGSPLLVLEALQLLAQESLLTRGDETWQCPDPDALMRRLGTLDVLQERLARLDPQMRELLLSLAVAGAPVSECVLESLDNSGTGATRERLMLAGWITTAAGAVTVRHDVLSRGVLESASAREIVGARAALATALARATILVDGEWRIHARLRLALDDMRGLSRVIDGWMALDRSRQLRRDWRGAADDLLGDLATGELLRRISAERSLADRFGHASRRASTVAAVVCIAGGFVGFFHHRSTTPTEIRFVTPPLAMSSMGIAPEVTVEILNASGERVRNRRDTVKLLLRSRSAYLEGPLRVITDSGYAVFASARGLGEQDVGTSLQAVSGQLRTAPARLLIPADVSLRMQRVQIVSGSPARLRGDTVETTVSARVALHIDLGYTSPWMASAVMLAGVPTWGDRTINSLELGPFATPIRNGTRFTPVTFTAPSVPGRYYLWLVMGAESDAAHIASATNWAAGDPRWYDGNDIADWGEREAATVRRSGQLSLPPTAYQYKNGRGPNALGVAVIVVVVTGQNGQVTSARPADLQTR